MRSSRKKKFATSCIAASIVLVSACPSKGAQLPENPLYQPAEINNRLYNTTEEVITFEQEAGGAEKEGPVSDGLALICGLALCYGLTKFKVCIPKPLPFNNKHSS